MTEVKPWEPVSAYMTNPWGWQSATAKFKLFEWAETAQNGWVLTCTLANSQRVIVRALSEDRKVARAFQKRTAHYQKKLEEFQAMEPQR